MDFEERNSVDSSNDDNGPERCVPGSMFRFRNYNPQTHFIDGLFSVEKSEPGSIYHLVQDKLGLASTKETGYRIDPKLMEPKKVDWDLKRRIEKRMEILGRETRNSIAKHVKDTKKRR